MDKDLVFKILEAINNGEEKYFNDFNVDKEEYAKHLRLIEEEGLAKGILLKYASNMPLIASIKHASITLKGLEFIGK